MAPAREGGMNGLNIDISGICNGKCPYCSTGNGKIPKNGFMSPQTLERVLYRLRDLGAMPRNNIAALYIWGEPLIHPQINEILKVISGFGLRAHISSNFIHLPELTVDALHTLSGMTFSLSSFTQTSYSYLHGGRLATTLANFNRLLAQVEKAHCDWKPFVNWHCYKFNEIEKSAAQAYFEQLGVTFTPLVAHLNDFTRTIRYFLKKDYHEADAAQIEEDLFTDFIAETLRRGRDATARCRHWDIMAIDPNANAIFCCTAPSDSMENNGIIGSIFDITIEDINRVHYASQACKVCRAGGFPTFPEIQNKGFSITRYLAEKPHNCTLEEITGRVSKTRLRTLPSFRKEAAPLVTLGIVAYNSEAFIRQTLDSALGLDYPNYEINIIEDVSTDSTGDICREYARKDKRVKYFRNPVNVGARRSYLRAFELCRGDYFVWAADHDLWHPDFIKVLLPVLLDDPEIALCYPQTILIDRNNKPMGLMANDTLDTHGQPAVERFKKVIRELTVCNMFHALYRASALRRVKSYGVVMGSDHVMLADLSLQGSIVQIKEPLFYRRQNRPPESFEQMIARHRQSSSSKGPELEWTAPFCYWGYEHLRIVQHSNLSIYEQNELVREIKSSFLHRWEPLIKDDIRRLLRTVTEYRQSNGLPYNCQLHTLELLQLINIARFFCQDPAQIEALDGLGYSLLSQRLAKLP